MQSFELFLFSFYIICIEPHPSVSEYCNTQLLVGIVGTNVPSDFLKLQENLFLVAASGVRQEAMVSGKKHLNANLCIGDLNVNRRGKTPHWPGHPGGGGSGPGAKVALYLGWRERRKRARRSGQQSGARSPGAQLVSQPGPGSDEARLTLSGLRVLHPGQPASSGHCQHQRLSNQRDPGRDAELSDAVTPFLLADHVLIHTDLMSRKETITNNNNPIVYSLSIFSRYAIEPNCACEGLFPIL